MDLLALRSASRDPWLNLALEEALLEPAIEGRSVLFLYENDPCVVVGRNQNPWAEVAVDAGLPVLRRVSGGGAVYHGPGNLNWALALPRAGHDPDAEIALVAAALGPLGVEAESGPRGGLFVAGSGPFRGRKFSGTARRLTADRVLHHGTLLVDADLGSLAASLGGLRLAASRAIASVPAQAVNLSELIPGLGLDKVAAALSRGLAGSAEPLDAERYLRGRVEPDRIEACARRLRGWDWTFGETPSFAVELPGPDGLLRIEVKGGKIASIGACGGVSKASTALEGLVGSPFCYDIAEKIALLYER